MAKFYFNLEKISPDLHLVTLKLDAESSVNALAGAFSVSDSLEIREIKTSQSVINFWLEEPKLKENNNEISFSGIIPGGLAGDRELFQFTLVGRPKALENLIIWNNDETKLFLNSATGEEASKTLENLSFQDFTEAKAQGYPRLPLGDEIPPESFTPLVSNSPDLLGGKNFVVFSTTDKQSGLDHYELAEKQSWFPVRESRLTWRKVESPSVLKDQKLSSFIYIKAVDQSGNEQIEVIHPSAPTFPFHPYFFFSIIIIMAIVLGFLAFKKFSKIGLFLFLFFLPFFANAADLNFSPSASSYKLGDVVSLVVTVSSADQAINAVQGNITFPTDKLEVINLAKSNTVGLWVAEPSFNNQTGQVNFEGIILNPGFKGPVANILTLNLRAKAEGAANVSFSNAAVLANDGLGTNVLKNLGTGRLVIGPTPGEITTPVVPIVPSVSLPAPLVITSETHPEPDRWYADVNPNFTWDLTKDVLAVRLLYDKYPTSLPSVYYDYRLTEKSLKDLKDGKYYFHAQARNSAGWGGVSHFRFQIDTTKPESFEVSEVKRVDSADPRVAFELSARDSGSGIAQYEIKINEGEAILIPAQASSTIYQTEDLTVGEYTLIAKALDQAGNYLVDYLDFKVESLAPPSITEYPERIAADSVLTIKGKTYTDSQVTINFGQNGEETKSETITSDALGNFTFSYDARDLKNGVYLFTASVTRSDGARSDPSNPVITVVEKSWFGRVSQWTVNFLTLFIPMFGLLLILILLILSSWRQLGRYRRYVKKETREAEETVERAFQILREDLEEHLKKSDKSKMAERLRENLSEAERLVKKEIKDISSR